MVQQNPSLIRRPIQNIPRQIPRQNFPPRKPIPPRFPGKPPSMSGSFPGIPQRKPEKDKTKKIMILAAALVFILLVALIIFLTTRSGENGENIVPECAEDFECSSGEVCDNGFCVSSTLVYCDEGEVRECGSDIGECSIGAESCVGGEWSGICDGEVAFTDEICDGLDNDCDVFVDEEGVCDTGTGNGGGNFYECVNNSDCINNENCINGFCVSDVGDLSCLPGQTRFCERNGLVGFQICLNGQWTICNVSTIDHSSGVQEEFFVWGKNYTSPFGIGDEIYARGFLNSCYNISDTGVSPCFGVGGLQVGEIVDGPQNFDAPVWIKVLWDDGQKGWEIIGGSYKDLRSLPSTGFNIAGHAGVQGSAESINGPARDIFRDSFYHWWKVEWNDGRVGWTRDYDIGLHQQGIEDYYLKKLEVLGGGMNIISTGTTLSVWDYPHEKTTPLASRDAGSRGIITVGPSISVGGLVMYRVRWSDGIEGWSVGDYLLLEDYGRALSNEGKKILSTGSTLSVRETPDNEGKLLASRNPGTEGVILDGPVKADNYLWFRVRWSDGIEGWSVGNFLLLEKSFDNFSVGNGITLADGVDSLNVMLEPSSDSEVMATRTRSDPVGTPLKLNDPVKNHYLSGITGYVRYFNEGEWWRRINWREMITYKGQENVLLIGWVKEDEIMVIEEELRIGMDVHSAGHNLAVRATPGGEWLEVAYGVGTITGGPANANGDTWHKVRWGISGTEGWSVSDWLEPDYYWTLA
jgi:hypothetical protein